MISARKSNPRKLTTYIKMKMHNITELQLVFLSNIKTIPIWIKWWATLISCRHQRTHFRKRLSFTAPPLTFCALGKCLYRLCKEPALHDISAGHDHQVPSSTLIDELLSHVQKERIMCHYFQEMWLCPWCMNKSNLLQCKIGFPWTCLCDVTLCSSWVKILHYCSYQG